MTSSSATLEVENQIFIFHKMEPATGAELLASTGKAWLIRESRTEGMLTVDTAPKEVVQKTDGKWKVCQNSSHFRFALTSKGWEQIAGDTGADYKGDKVSVTAANAKEYKDQLNQLLLSLDLPESTRLNPDYAQQSKNSIFSAYVRIPSPPPANTFQVLQALKAQGMAQMQAAHATADANATTAAAPAGAAAPPADAKKQSANVVPKDGLDTSDSTASGIVVVQPSAQTPSAASARPKSR